MRPRIRACSIFSMGLFRRAPIFASLASPALSFDDAHEAIERDGKRTTRRYIALTLGYGVNGVNGVNPEDGEKPDTKGGAA